jgi:hypothetical protein
MGKRTPQYKSRFDVKLTKKRLLHKGNKEKLNLQNYTFRQNIIIKTNKKTMNIHLIKTPEYDANDFIKVFNLLRPFNGIVTFSSGTSLLDDAALVAAFPFLKYNLLHLTWNEIFDICNAYRNKFNIPKQDFVVLLTNRRNEHNWFSSIDANLERNIFVQTSDWHLFVECPHEFPVVYEIVANILQNLMQVDVSRLDLFVHQIPEGCINDFCGTKTEITIKLRTADVCRVCLDKLYVYVNPLLVKFFTKILEDIRPNMLNRSNHAVEPRNLGSLSIGDDYRLFVCHPDFENIEIPLSPTQKAIYFLFLKHKSGIEFKKMVKYKPEFSKIYNLLTKTEDTKKIELTIDKICNGQENNFKNLNTYISQIEKIFRDKLSGNEDLIRYFCITGERDKVKTIALERTMLVISNNIAIFSPS